MRGGAGSGSARRSGVVEAQLALELAVAARACRSRAGRGRRASAPGERAVGRGGWRGSDAWALGRRRRRRRAGRAAPRRDVRSPSTRRVRGSSPSTTGSGRWRWRDPPAGVGEQRAEQERDEDAPADADRRLERPARVDRRACRSGGRRRRNIAHAPAAMITVPSPPAGGTRGARRARTAARARRARRAGSTPRRTSTTGRRSASRRPVGARPAAPPKPVCWYQGRNIERAGRARRPPRAAARRAARASAAHAGDEARARRTARERRGAHAGAPAGRAHASEQQRRASAVRDRPQLALERELPVLGGPLADVLELVLELLGRRPTRPRRARARARRRSATGRGPGCPACPARSASRSSNISAVSSTEPGERADLRQVEDDPVAGRHLERLVAAALLHPDEAEAALARGREVLRRAGQDPGGRGRPAPCARSLRARLRRSPPAGLPQGRRTRRRCAAPTARIATSGASCCCREPGRALRRSSSCCTAATGRPSTEPTRWTRWRGTCAARGWAAVEPRVPPRRPDVRRRLAAERARTCWPGSTTSPRSTRRSTWAASWSSGFSSGGQLALWAAARAPRVTGAGNGRGPAAVRIARRHRWPASCTSRAAASRAVVAFMGADVRSRRPSATQQASPAERLPLGVPTLLVHGDRDLVAAGLDERALRRARPRGRRRRDARPRRRRGPHGAGRPAQRLLGGDARPGSTRSAEGRADGAQLSGDVLDGVARRRGPAAGARRASRSARAAAAGSGAGSRAPARAARRGRARRARWRARQPRRRRRAGARRRPRRRAAGEGRRGVLLLLALALGVQLVGEARGRAARLLEARAKVGQRVAEGLVRHRRSRSRARSSRAARRRRTPRRSDDSRRARAAGRACACALDAHDQLEADLRDADLALARERQVEPQLGALGVDRQLLGDRVVQDRGRRRRRRRARRRAGRASPRRRPPARRTARSGREPG